MCSPYKYTAMHWLMINLEGAEVKTEALREATGGFDLKMLLKCNPPHKISMLDALNWNLYYCVKSTNTCVVLKTLSSNIYHHETWIHQFALTSFEQILTHPRTCKEIPTLEFSSRTSFFSKSTSGPLTNFV